MRFYFFMNIFNNLYYNIVRDENAFNPVPPFHSEIKDKVFFFFPVMAYLHLKNSEI